MVSDLSNVFIIIIMVCSNAPFSCVTFSFANHIPSFFSITADKRIEVRTICSHWPPAKVEEEKKNVEEGGKGGVEREGEEEDSEE